MHNFMNNSYIEVDTGILLENARAILAGLGGAELIPVLKDAAYGLGMAPVAAVLCTLPEIRCIALSHVSEGLALRAAGNDQHVSRLGGQVARLVPVDGHILDELECVHERGIVLRRIGSHLQRRVHRNV